MYLYRAFDKFGKTLYFMLSEQQETFFKQAVGNNSALAKVVIDKSGANHAGLSDLNLLPFLLGCWPMVEILEVKYRKNIVEQDYRFIRKITKPMKGFKAFHSASATVQGIDVAHMIRKEQLGETGLTPFQQFSALAA